MHISASAEFGIVLFLSQKVFSNFRKYLAKSFKDSFVQPNSAVESGILEWVNNTAEWDYQGYAIC